MIAAQIASSTALGASFALALSGGKTPRRMLELLDPEALIDDGLRTFQVDERVAPDGDADRNLTQLQATLPAAALERLIAMPVLGQDLEAAAASYASALPESIDLVHLGLGPDGHTASLVPGDEVLEVKDRLVAITSGEYQGRRRMTLTYPALEAADRILWLVTGEDKREALDALMAADSSIPAGRVAPRDALVICDRAAAG